MPSKISSRGYTPWSSNAYQSATDASGTVTVTPVTATNSYTNAFPSLQAKYEIQPKLITRATWSSTLARPGFNQSNVSKSVDLGSLIVTDGNPNLKPATANSFDLSIEDYLEGAGILSLGVFDKEIKDYIVANNNGLLVLRAVGGEPAAGRVLDFRGSILYRRRQHQRRLQRNSHVHGFWQLVRVRGALDRLLQRQEPAEHAAQFYQRSSERVIQREFYGQDFLLGVRFDY